MTELELVRELGDETSLRDLTELTDARALLTRAIASEREAAPEPLVRRVTRARRPRRWRLVVAATATAAAAGAAAFGAFSSRLPPLAHPTAAQVLNRAAFVALHTATVTPSGDQFVYTKTENEGGPTVQAWMSLDGTRTSRVGAISMPGCVNGQMSLRKTGEGGKPLSDGPIFRRRCTPQPAYFPTMPTQPGRILPYLERTQGVRPHELNDVAKTVGELLDSDFLLPAQQAALYTFLARTPGIAVQRGVTDAAGRPGVGVVWSFDASQAMLIFDPQTYTYLGTSTRGIGGRLSGTALLTTAIVDSVGRLPGPGTTPAPTDGA